MLLAASVTAFTILKIAGALYLAWLAYDAIRHGSALSLEKRERREPLRAVYLKGLMVNLLNPKVIIFFVTFLPQFVSTTDPDAAKKLLFLGLFFTAINIPVCAAADPFRRRHRRASSAVRRRSPASSTTSSPACSALLRQTDPDGVALRRWSHPAG